MYKKQRYFGSNSGGCSDGFPVVIPEVDLVVYQGFFRWIFHLDPPMHVSMVVSAVIAVTIPVTIPVIIPVVIPVVILLDTIQQYKIFNC